MNNGFDYITSGNYAGDWLQIQFLAETVATLTPHTGDSVTGTFAAGQQLVGTFVEVNVTSGVMLAYRRGATAKRSLTDADFQAVLNRGTTLGYSLPTGTALTAGDTLVKSLKSAGIWNKLDIFYVFATNGDSDFATLNWKTPASFQATKVNAPTFTSLEGFTGDGASSYLSLNYNTSTDATNLSLDNNSIGAYNRNATANGALISAFGANILEITNDNTNTRCILFNNSGAARVPTIASQEGFYLNTRATSATFRAWRNNTELSILAVTSVAIPNATMRVLARSNNTVYGNGQVSIAFAGADLSAEQSDLYTAIQTYMTAIGKQV